MSQASLKRLDERLEESRQACSLKRFRTLESPIGARVRKDGMGEVLILASTDSLGLANHPEVTRAGQDAISRYGAGASGTATPENMAQLDYRLDPLADPN